MTMIAKVGFAAEIEAYAKEKGPLTLGLAGAGQMGIDIVLNLSMLPGLRLGAVSEIRVAKAQEAAAMSGRSREDVVFAPTAAAIDRAIESGKLASDRGFSSPLRVGAHRRHHRRHRQPELRRPVGARSDPESQAHRDAQRRGRHHHRPLPQRGSAQGGRRLHRRGRRRTASDGRTDRLCPVDRPRSDRGGQGKKQRAEIRRDPR